MIDKPIKKAKKLSKFARIKKLLAGKFSFLFISFLGRKSVFEETYKEVKKENPNLEPRDLVKQVYGFNYKNRRTPEDIKEKPNVRLVDFEPDNSLSEKSIKHLQSDLKELLNKQKDQIESTFKDILDQEDLASRYKEISDVLYDTDMLAEQRAEIIRGLSDKLGKNWERIVATELSNNVGHASIDFILNDTKDKDPNNIYVYRINPDDALTCKECRKFYIDRDKTPKLYRLTTIVGNGTNYGKKRADWLPVVVSSTHPFCRDSQLY